MDGFQGDIPDSVILGFYMKGFSEIVVNTSLWAMYLILFPISLRALFRHRVWSGPNIFLGVATLLMFVITNAYFFPFLYFQTEVVQTMLRNSSKGLSNFARMEMAQTGIMGSRVIEALPRLLNFIIGDAVVVQRAFVIARVEAKDHPRRVLALRVILVVLFLGSIAMSIYDFSLSLLYGRSLAFALTPHSNLTADILAITLSFFTNLFATLSIGMSTHRQILASLSLSDHSNKPIRRVVRLLVLLTETAVIYCLLQLVAILVLAIPTKAAGIGDILTGAYMTGLNILSALYPTLLIIIFTRQANGPVSSAPSPNWKRMGSDANQSTPQKFPVSLASIPETLTYPDMTQNSTVEMDHWQKARGSYTNFV